MAKSYSRARHMILLLNSYYIPIKNNGSKLICIKENTPFQLSSTDRAVFERESTHLRWSRAAGYKDKF